MATVADPKASAEDGYRRVLVSQIEAISSVTELGDDTYTWCFMVAVRAGLPQQGLADKIGVTQPTISRWTRGDNLPKNPVVREAYVSELLSMFAAFIIDNGGPKLNPVLLVRPKPRQPRRGYATAKPA